MSQINKKIGFGTISLILCMMGIIFAFSFGDKGCYGDTILKYIGLSPWSDGNRGIHYTTFYSVIFFIPSLILGYKFKNNFGAILGKTLSLIMIVLILIVFPIYSIL